jgi:hypothetical protein
MDIVDETHEFFPWHLIGFWLVAKCPYSHQTHANEQHIEVIIRDPWIQNVLHFIFMFTINFNRWKGIMDSSRDGRCVLKFQQGNMKHKMDSHKTWKLELKSHDIGWFHN